MTCLLCGERIAPDEDIRHVFDGETGQPRPTHRICMLRNVLGGIGHLENHAYWCKERHDPDGGRTYYQSALAVEAWVDQHGIDAAVIEP